MNCERQSSFVCENLPATTAALAIALTLAFILAQPAQAQTYQVIYNFTGGLDGAYPEAGLTERGGSFYGTAYQGGSANRGTVYKLARSGASWIINPLYSFTGGADGSAPLAEVVFAGDGTIYGTTEFGGRNCGVGCGTVFHLRPPLSVCKAAVCSWTENVVYEFSGSSDGANPGYGQLTFDQTGNLYGTTFFGGVNAQGVVYELTPSGGGWTERAIHTFSGASDGANPYNGVAFDATGALYGATYSGGAHAAGAVFQLTHSGSGWAESTLHSFQSTSDGGNPFGGVVFDSAGNVYGTTSGGGAGGGGTVYQLTSSGGNWTFGVVYGFNGSAHLPGPYASLTMDAAGNLYGTTTQDGAHGAGSVFKLTPSGGGWTETDLYDFPGGSQGAIPYGRVFVDASGNLYGTASQGGTHDYGVVWEITP